MQRDQINLTGPVLSTVLEKYKFPFEPDPVQVEAIEALAPLKASGMYADPGCGKTFMSTVAALYKLDLEPDLCTFVIMPPILIRQWYDWLTKEVEGIEPSTVVKYVGTPAQRAAMDLSKAAFVLMSTPIFKRDRKSLLDRVQGRPLFGILDEAHSIKNVSSDNYRMFRDTFALYPGNELTLLTGSPLNTPIDAYAYVKLVSPNIYASKQQFLNLHVETVDHFNNPVRFKNLDLLHENLMVGSVRILKQDVFKNLKHPHYVPLRYDLSPSHKKLYDKLMRDQLLELESGGKIDATTAQRLLHCAQQIVCNYEHFSEGDEPSAALDLVDAVVDELDLANSRDNQTKLLIFAQYRMTNRRLLEHLKDYGAVACYSEISRAKQTEAETRFREDPTCRVLVAHPLSAGYGLNFQDCCADVLFLESPTVPGPFHQGLARVYRLGQKRTPTVRIAIASGTVQERLHSRLLKNDELVNVVQGGYQDLKDAIYGE